MKGVKNCVQKKSCGEEKEEKNKRVVDSFILQHPILDYISGSCFLCVVLWPGPKKGKKKKAAKISFNLLQKLKCLSATPTREPKSTALSDIGRQNNSNNISLSVAVAGRHFV